MNLAVLAHLSSVLTARLHLRSERGATAVEYGIMVALIAVVIILAVVFLGREVSSTFQCTGEALDNAPVGTTC
ncbi:MAG TPA: Flp family type IVb pilin [Actinomycetota bacterium]